MMIDLRSARSILFLPASNPRAIAKARGAGDRVVLDLEDGVEAAEKQASAASRGGAGPSRGDAGARPRQRRSQPWHEDDLTRLLIQRQSIVLPRAVRPTVRALTGKPAAVCHVETAAGGLRAHDRTTMRPPDRGTTIFGERSCRRC